MRFIYRFICWLNRLLDGFKVFDFLAPLAIRLYLAPVFFIMGMEQYNNMDRTIEWFGNAESGLGLPYADILAKVATGTEIIGAVLLVLGLAVRWVSLPLMAIVAVTAIKENLQHGWQHVADGSAAFASSHLGPLAFENMSSASERLDKAISILKEHGDYNWLIESGNFAVLNNGMQMPAILFIMLLVLFFMGAGKVFSLDFWLRRGCPTKKTKPPSTEQPKPVESPVTTDSETP